MKFIQRPLKLLFFALFWIEISPENKKYAVSSSKSEDYTFYAHPEVFFINKTNIVSVEISQYIAEDGTEMYHGGQLIIRVNNGVANYKVHDFSQPENLDYISFVATNDGKRDEFFYIEWILEFKWIIAENSWMKLKCKDAAQIQTYDFIC